MLRLERLQEVHQGCNKSNDRADVLCVVVLGFHEVTRLALFSWTMGFIVSSTGLFTGFMVFCGSGWVGTVCPAGVVFGGTKGVGWWWFEGGARVGRLRGITTASASLSSLDAPSVCATLGLGGCRRCGMVLGGPLGLVYLRLMANSHKRAVYCGVKLSLRYGSRSCSFSFHLSPV